MTAMLRPGTLNFSIKSGRESVIGGLSSVCGTTAALCSIRRICSALAAGLADPPTAEADCPRAAGAMYDARAAARAKAVVHFVSSIDGESFRPGGRGDSRASVRIACGAAERWRTAKTQPGNDKDTPTHTVCQTEMFPILSAARSGFGESGTPGECSKRSVADVLKVFDADLAGVKAVAGHLAKAGKESYPLAEPGIRFRVFAISDEVEDFFPLRGSAIEKSGAVLVGTEIIKPHQAAAEFKLILVVLAGEEIDEFRRAGFNGSAGFFVRGNNGVAQGDQSLELVRREKLGSIPPCRGRRFGLLHHLMSEPCRFRRNHLQDRARPRANCKISEQIASGNSLHGLPSP